MSHQELFSRQVHITQVFIIPPPTPPRLQPFLTVPPFTLKYDTIYMTLTNAMLGGG